MVKCRWRQAHAVVCRLRRPRQVTLAVAVPSGPGSTVHGWLPDDPHDPELVKVIETMPMDTLAAFGGDGFRDAYIPAEVEL